MLTVNIQAASGPLNANGMFVGFQQGEGTPNHQGGFLHEQHARSDALLRNGEFDR